jgi:hypothetical protein
VVSPPLQALRIRRRRLNLTTGRWSTVTLYAITNLTAAQAGPTDLADALRGHWAIEILHNIRDTTYAEDACWTCNSSGNVAELQVDTLLEGAIGGRYPLAEAGRAHRDLQSRSATGKLLLTVGADAGC